MEAVAERSAYTLGIRPQDCNAIHGVLENLFLAIPSTCPHRSSILHPLMPFPALDVLYEDNHLLVLNKPAGLPTMGTPGPAPTLLTLAKDYIKQKYQKPGNVYLGVMSRLDAPVTGVVLLARTSKAAARMTEQFRTHAVQKTYWTLVAGTPHPASGSYTDWLIQDERHRRMHVVDRHPSGGEGGTPAYRSAFQRWPDVAPGSRVGNGAKAPNPAANGPSWAPRCRRPQVRQPVEVPCRDRTPRPAVGCRPSGPRRSDGVRSAAAEVVAAGVSIHMKRMKDEGEDAETRRRGEDRPCPPRPRVPAVPVSPCPRVPVSPVSPRPHPPTAQQFRKLPQFAIVSDCRRWL